MVGFTRIRPPSALPHVSPYFNMGCVTLALPFTLKSMSGEEKNYENSNISPCKKYYLQKIL
jgi:hypothetical protein